MCVCVCVCDPPRFLSATSLQRPRQAFLLSTSHEILKRGFDTEQTKGTRPVIIRAVSLQKYDSAYLLNQLGENVKYV